MDRKQYERELAALNKELETPENNKKSLDDLETPEQKNLKNIAIALRGIENQLSQLNKSLRKK